MQQGWIKLYRSMVDNEFWQEERTFSRGEAWIDLLLMVNHEERKVLVGNKTVVVKPGERLTSIAQLSERWGWSRCKTKMFLDLLQEENMITYQSTTKYTLVTIVKWDFYQNDTDSHRHHFDNKTTTNQHQIDTNKNEKNEKNDENEKKNNTPLPPQGHESGETIVSNVIPMVNTEEDEGFRAFWAVYPKRVNKESASKAWKRLNPDETTVQAIVKAVEKQKATEQWRREKGRYIPYPATWLNGKRWEDEEANIDEQTVTGATAESAQGKWAGCSLGVWY